MTRMRNPPHPGATLRDDVLPTLGLLSVTRAAEQLGVTRAALRACSTDAPRFLPKWRCAWRDGSALRMAAAQTLGSHSKPPTICGKPVKRASRKSRL